MSPKQRTASVLLVTLGLAACRPTALDDERLKVFQLAAFLQLDELEERADALWPAGPELEPAYEAWLAEADTVVAGLPQHRAQITKLERDGDLEANVEDAWWHAQLLELVERIEAFADADTGLLRGTAAPHGWGIRRRLDYARSVSTAKVAGHAPQLGLVALGPDPDTGLQEFADPQTGTVPERDVAGRLRIDGDTGLVFVLLPGGTFTLGAQDELPLEANFDPAADTIYESPPHEVTLAPFFASKYELTQGQWQRFTGANPSEYFSGRSIWTSPPRRPVGPRNPVESVSWHEAHRTLARLGFALPTEAQWEYAARAGTATPWTAGEFKQALDGSANIADRSADATGIYHNAETWLQDGYVYHAPVGLYDANGFGLHDVHGNVWEWCRDWAGTYGVNGVGVDGERLVALEGRSLKIFRGGSFQDPAVGVRVSRRATYYPRVASGVIGLRPVRALAD